VLPDHLWLPAAFNLNFPMGKLVQRNVKTVKEVVVFRFCAVGTRSAAQQTE
jgi:hypothetical protein